MLVKKGNGVYDRCYITDEATCSEGGFVRAVGKLD
jgi:hypothetical protein